MVRSTRAVLAMGLGCLGVVGLIAGRSLAQGPADGKVQRVASSAPTANGAAPTAAAAAPALAIGTLDVERVFKDYDKVKVLGETLEGEVKARYNELATLATQGKQAAAEHEKMNPGSADAKKLEDKMTQLKADIEAKRENAQREFSQKEATMMVEVYNEIAAMAEVVAKRRGMTVVLKYNEGKLTSSEPNSAMAAMSKTVIYADPRFDITTQTLEFLNYSYKAKGGPAPKNPGSAPMGAPAPGAGARPAQPAAGPR